MEFEALLPWLRTLRWQLGPKAGQLAMCLEFDMKVNRLGDRMGNYAYLKTTEDQTNGDYQRMIGRFQNIAVRASEASSFMRPEILAIEAPN